MDNTLFLRLESHLQSYVSGQKLRYIHTNTEPTKSAVMGMICAAFGLHRNETFGPLQNFNRLLCGVRVDLEGVDVLDFQVLRPGHVPLANEDTRTGQGGGEKVGDISHRHY